MKMKKMHKKKKPHKSKKSDIRQFDFNFPGKSVDIKIPKTVMATFINRNESAIVLKEMQHTALIQFEHIGSQPIDERKKSELKLLFGDTWN